MSGRPSRLPKQAKTFSSKKNTPTYKTRFEIVVLQTLEDSIKLIIVSEWENSNTHLIKTAFCLEFDFRKTVYFKALKEFYNRF